MAKTNLTRRLLLQLFFIQQVLFQLTLAEDSCPASGKGSLYSNLPQKYRMQGHLIVHYILSNEKVGSLDACGEKCKDDTKSKSCAYYPNGRICYLFSEKFDDIEIALQLNYGWQHISIKDDGTFVIREKHLPCNHDYCKDTCLPGYTTKCFAGLSGPDCDKYDGVYESCLQYQTMKTYGKEPRRRINAVALGSTIFPVFLPSGRKTIEMTCYFESDDIRFQRLAPQNFEDRSSISFPLGSGTANPFHHMLAFSLPEDIIKTFLANGKCGHRIYVELKGIEKEKLEFVESDRRRMDIKNVPGCSTCGGYSYSNDQWKKSLYIENQLFIPVREIIASDLDSKICFSVFGLSYCYSKSVSIKNHYLYCQE